MPDDSQPPKGALRPAPPPSSAAEGPRAGALRALIARWEPELGAFTALDDAGFADLDAGQGPLAGLAVGVKDVIDLRGLPTRNGSRTGEGAAPAARDAAVVAALRAAGAAIVGKTVTTEFAFIDPTGARNPFDFGRSPGGSSAGSGAAVGAGILDLALGTQTAGSLCRPAAYCGAVAFKPSLGLLSTEGVTPLAPSFDTVGLIARDVAVAAAAFAACAPLAAAPAPANSTEVPRIARATVDPAAPMTAEATAALDAAAEALGAGPAVATGVDLAAVVADHRIVMLAEAAAAHGHRPAALLQPKFAAALAEGRALSPATVEAARARLAAARARFWAHTEGIDALVAPPVPEGAPTLDGTTGYQHLQTPWTVFGGPLLALPWGLDALGRPRSVMLAGRPGGDAGLLAVAQRLEAAAPPLPRPTPPR